TNTKVTYTQLSVGQADASVVEDGKYTAVIDTGENGAVVTNYLLGMGKKIDALFITHLHMDHIGGLRELLDAQVEIEELFIPLHAKEMEIDEKSLQLLEEVEKKNIPITYIGTGDQIHFPRTTFHVLWPDKQRIRKQRPANDYSLVLGVETGETLLLTTGDITGYYEKYSAVDADILKVSHHGSKYSSEEEYLRKVTPKVAIISSGTSERLPSPETLERMDALTIPYYCTNETGSITVTFTNNDFFVELFSTQGEKP
ncbi:MAG: MBL fold metallo-hydrolase, partial [Clostridiales bacterium]|nr:MBL fold metallo-hydrolase [Clostridiales bacterium]